MTLTSFHQDLKIHDNEKVQNKSTHRTLAFSLRAIWWALCWPECQGTAVLPANLCWRYAAVSRSISPQDSHPTTLTILKDGSDLKRQFRAVLCLTRVYCSGLPIDNAAEATGKVQIKLCKTTERCNPPCTLPATSQSSFICHQWGATPPTEAINQEVKSRQGCSLISRK